MNRVWGRRDLRARLGEESIELHNAMVSPQQTVVTYDAFGVYDWASSWRVGTPLGGERSDAAVRMIHRSIQQTDLSAKLEEVRAGTFQLPNGWACRLLGQGDTQPALAVANLTLNTLIRLPRTVADHYENVWGLMGLPLDSPQPLPGTREGWRLQCENGSISCASHDAKPSYTLSNKLKACFELIEHRRATEKSDRAPVIPVGCSYGAYYGWNEPAAARSLLVANREAGRAHRVDDFYADYLSTLFPETDLAPLHELLGPPTSDSWTEPDGRLRQRFQGGELERRPGAATTLKRPEAQSANRPRGGPMAPYDRKQKRRS